MPTILSTHQTALLTAALNTLIPARADLPGAGDLGLAAKIDAALMAAPIARRVYLEGLVAIDAAGGRPFVELADGDREDALRAVETTLPIFFASLVEYTYRYYYTHPRVQRSLGMTDGPPQPRGHHLPAFDEQLLTIQRKREPFWRRLP